MTALKPANAELVIARPAAGGGMALHDPGAGGPPARFLAGAGLALGGVGFTLRHRALLGWALAAMAVQAVLFVALLLLGWSQLGAWTTTLAPEPGHWYSALAPAVRWLLIFAVVAGSALGAMLAAGVVCDPLHDLLSETTEAILLGHEVESRAGLGAMARGVLRELGATLWRFGIYLGGVLLLFLIGLTGVGSVVAAPASLAWTWLFLAAEVLSRSQGRHAQGARARITEGARARMKGVMQHRALALGFGAGGWLLSWLPLSTPFLTVGGTRLHLALAAYDRLPSALSADDKARLRGASPAELVSGRAVQRGSG